PYKHTPTPLQTTSNGKHGTNPSNTPTNNTAKTPPQQPQKTTPTPPKSEEPFKFPRNPKFFKISINLFRIIRILPK
ncbi:hypothetical protein R6G85_01325, partial [Actinotignum urinale]|nr:hypothetical protein [Actinotignum urinale]